MLREVFFSFYARIGEVTFVEKLGAAVSLPCKKFEEISVMSVFMVFPADVFALVPKGKGWNNSYREGRSARAKKCDVL